MKNLKFIFQIFLSLSIVLVLLNNNLLSQCPITAVIPSPTLIGSGAEGYVYINPGNSNEALTAEYDDLSNGTRNVNVYNTLNSGSTWTNIATLKGYNEDGCADPSVVIDGSTGTYYVAYVDYTTGCDIYISISRGGIWSGPNRIYQSSSNNYTDKPFLWNDNGNSSYSGRLYCSWSNLYFMQLNGILFAYSSDWGNSWTQSPNLYYTSDNTIRESGSVIQTGSNGNVYVAWVEYNAQLVWQKIYINVSTDGGANWVYPTNSPYLAVYQPYLGSAEFHSTGVGPSMVLDNNNNIFLFWSSELQNATNYTVNYVKGTYSNTQGFIFGSVSHIQQLTNYNYIYPWASYDPISNRIACIYRATLNNPIDCYNSSCTAGTGISISCDGIANWVTPYQEKVSNSVQTWCPDDYIGISYYNNVCIGVWSEGTTNSNFSSYSHEIELINPNPTSPLIVSCGQIISIPDSTHLVFNNTGTYMKIDSGAVILLGNGSTIEFYNGAYLCAINDTFTSLNSNSPWDGIYLSSSNGDDTITNCVFVNSANGINIVDKNSININSLPSTQITGCTFIDSSNTELNNGIYCTNSANVLIRNNSFYSSSLAEGFLSAITMLYSSGSLDILDNTINNVTNGMSIIQSSPFVERNIINGQQTDGTGIILDNSNGSLKYNTINYFSEALVTYYSSAYLFRNNFNYSATKLVDLYKSSSPVLKPITSSGTLMWLGGNNNFNGNPGAPSQYGIGVNDVSFPALDSGFNNIMLNGANYMSGNLSGDTLFAAYNFWGDRPPNNNKLAITAGTVIDTPDYDGTSVPQTSGYDLTDIGFGLYDTVYTSGSGNNPGADNLYAQAYSDEASKNYTDAISLYKQVVSTYKTSNLVPAAISRIINCMEKKLSANREYSDLQNYMTQVRNNNDIPYTVQEIAEDLIIKSMVRQNIYPNSINNYDTMYQHNQGNHKGTHALINKLSLLSFYEDSSGNRMTRNRTNQNKLSLLSLLTGKQILQSHVSNNPVMPKEFKLYQNYPNPFNPTTKIKYDIPKYSNVTIKIYDLLGREIYSSSEYKTPGTYELQFDGSRYASGVYFYRIQASDFVAVKKMVLIK